MTQLRNAELVTGFEHGSTALFTASSNASVQSTTKRTGTYALRVNPSAASGYAKIPFDGPKTTEVYAGCALYVTTKPSADTIMFGTYNTLSNDVIVAIRHINSDGKLYASIWDANAGTWTNASTGVSYSTGAWFHVQYFVDQTTDSGFNVFIDVDWAVDAVEQAHLQRSVLIPDGAQYVQFGGNSTSPASDTGTYDFYADDVFVIAGLGDPTGGTYFPEFPVPDCFVTLMTPTGDGTHSTAASFTDDLANSPPASVYDRLDEIPVVNSTSGRDYVYQSTIGTSDYLETTNTISVPTLPTGGDAQFGIAMALRFGWFQSTASVADVDLYIRDTTNSSTLTGVSTNGNSTSKVWAASGPAAYLSVKENFTKAVIQGYRFRLGTSSDVTDSIFVDDIHAEIAWYGGPTDNDGWSGWAWHDGQESWGYM